MDLPPEVPVMTLPDAILFPQAVLPLYIFEPRYRRLLKDALRSNRMFCVARQKPGRTRETPSAVAGVGLIRACVTKKDGTSNLILQGLARVELVATVKTRPYRLARVRQIYTPAANKANVLRLAAKVLELVSRRLEQGFDVPLESVTQLMEGKVTGLDDSLGGTLSAYALKNGVRYLASLNDPGQMADLISSALLPGPSDRQIILETADLETRLNNLVGFLMAEIRRHKKGKQS